ncbi:MAG: hypothetical protein HFE68_05030 [Erysipelotrichaceae bacterium]|nr:hypothetical protein [Erysipelotrichaceae bacterium]
MKTAFTKVDITPYLPVQLSGFGKLQVAYEVHDRLYARIFLFEQAESELLLVQLDLAIFDEYLLNVIADYCKVAKERLIVCSTHTHSGPGGTIDTYEGLLVGLDSDIGGCLNPEYCHRIASDIGAATARLRTATAPCSLRIYKGKVEGLGTNRHDPQMECDQDAFVLELITAKQKALITRMSSHATVLHEENLLVSADFPGCIEPHFTDEYEMVAFINGSAGDMSPRFTRKECSFAECERLGKLAADQLKEMMKQEVVTYTDFTMDYRQAVFKVPAKKVDSVEVAREKVEIAKQNLAEGIKKNLPPTEIRLLESYVEGAGNALLSCEAFRKFSEIEVNVSALILPELTIVFTPVEMFSMLSNQLKPYGLEFISYTNGFKGYMPDESAYAKNYYEVLSTPYACGSGELLMRNIKSWLIDSSK